MRADDHVRHIAACVVLGWLNLIALGFDRTQDADDVLSASVLGRSRRLALSEQMFDGVPLTVGPFCRIGCEHDRAGVSIH